MSRRFPILDSSIRSIPWDMIESQECQAIDNHDQSLSRLAERGGLCPSEALAVLDGRKWKRMNEAEADDELRRRVAVHEDNEQRKRIASLEAQIAEARAEIERLKARDEHVTQYRIVGPGGTWFANLGGHARQWWVEKTVGVGEHFRFESKSEAIEAARKLARGEAPVARARKGSPEK